MLSLIWQTLTKEHFVLEAEGTQGKSQTVSPKCLQEQQTLEITKACEYVCGIWAE